MPYRVRALRLTQLVLKGHWKITLNNLECLCQVTVNYGTRGHKNIVKYGGKYDIKGKALFTSYTFAYTKKHENNDLLA